MRRSGPGRQAIDRLARAGYIALGFVNIVVAWLALQIAFGRSKHQANPKGALADVAGHPLGKVLLCLLALGFLGYAAWRFTEAAFGKAVEGKQVWPRLLSAALGIFATALAVTTVALLLGSGGKSQSGQQVTLTARVMRHTFGRGLVGIAGLVVIGIGVGMIVQGVRRAFEKQLELGQTSAATHRTVVTLGLVGNVARGVVFCIAGWLVVQAAITFDAKKSTGLDGALRTVAHQPYGQVLLIGIALGLLAFGLYELAAARWAKT
jgi:hypothetical protein